MSEKQEFSTWVGQEESLLNEFLEQYKTASILLPGEEYDDGDDETSLLYGEVDSANDTAVSLSSAFSLSRYANGHLLSPEKELDLLRTILEGEQAKNQLPFSRSEEERRELEQKISEGQLALSDLIVANIGLVYHTIRVSLGPSLVANEDLVQEGIIGMIKAARMYSPSCGTKFSTYATYWIKHAVFRAIRNQMREIRLPVRTEEMIARILRAVNVLTQELHREPTIPEISAYVKIPPRKVEELIALARPPLSLDAPIGEEDDGFSLCDLLPSPIPDPADEIEREELRNIINDLVGHLPDKEEDVIRRVYAIGWDSPQSLAEIGREYGISKEAVRQRVSKAMARLHHLKVRRMLSGFL